MTQQIIGDIQVCIDCVMARENGETEGLTPKRIEELWQHYPNHEDVTLNSRENEETGEIEGYDDFSWSPCQACGSSLGGSRHTYAVWG